MPIPEWQEQLIQAAARWPRGFGACLRNGAWQFFGAPEGVESEFCAWAERVAQEHHFRRTGVDPAGALLYRLKAAGHYVRSKAVFRKHSKAASAVEQATISPLRSALVRYTTSGFSLPPNNRSTSENMGQPASSKKNRIRATRLSIIAALQKLGHSPVEYPSCVRDFLKDSREYPEFHQLVSVPLFQPRPLDRLKESVEGWAKSMDKDYERYRADRVRSLRSWVYAGVDDAIPGAKRIRTSRRSAMDSRRGTNTPVDQRYRWAAQYLCGVPLKEIAAQSSANPSTVGRIARAILQAAEWHTPRSPRRTANRSGHLTRGRPHFEAT